jgi:hypothetical protein
MDRYCEVAISIYSKIGKNQVLVYYEYCYGFLSCKFSFFVFRYFTSSENIDSMTNIFIFYFLFKWNFYMCSIWRSFFISGTNIELKIILRNNMINGAYDLLLFYISGSAMVAQEAYPPYGFVSLSFTRLACY